MQLNDYDDDNAKEEFLQELVNELKSPLEPPNLLQIIEYTALDNTMVIQYDKFFFIQEKEEDEDNDINLYVAVGKVYVNDSGNIKLVVVDARTLSDSQYDIFNNILEKFKKLSIKYDKNYNFFKVDRELSPQDILENILTTWNYKLTQEKYNNIIH